jgi:hypothetical protein
MAHFALVNNNNIVQEVIVVADADCAGGDLPASEPAGQAFLLACGLPGHWVQTSYHANFRGKYAGIGDIWDGTNFVTPGGDE